MRLGYHGRTFCDMCEDIEIEEYHLVTGCDIRCICGRWHRV